MTPVLDAEDAVLHPDGGVCNSTDWNFCAQHVQGTVKLCSSFGATPGETCAAVCGRPVLALPQGFVVVMTRG